MTSTAVFLANSWRGDVAALTGSPGVLVYGGLMARHAEAHRRYHGLSHLRSLVDLMNQHASHIPPGSPARLAIWWHDAVYDPRARDNEDRSADLARSDLSQLGADATLIDAVCELILASRNHWEGGSLGDGDAFLDADIAILGAPPAAYEVYAEGVRLEYSWASPEQFRAGRAAFLSSALARKRLFRTDVFEAAFAVHAWKNMAHELNRLTPDPV